MSAAAPSAKTLLLALRMKHSSDAVIREVVIDDPLEEGYRFRERINRYTALIEADGDHASHWVQGELERAAARGVTIPDALPDGWSLSSSIPRRRIDALIIASTGRTAVEIKVTRADFKRDTDEKRRAWRAICHRFIYLTPKGLIQLDQVPEGCGLIELDPESHDPRYLWNHGLTTVKRATITKTPDPLPWQVTQALAYRVSRHEWTEARS